MTASSTIHLAHSPDSVDAFMFYARVHGAFDRHGVESHLVAVMGAWWLQKTGLPLPLGRNVIRKDMPRDVQKKVSRHLRQSIAYGLDHRKNALDHARRFARGLDRSKADTFVGMYVNDWTLDYGNRGRAAIRLFLDEGVRAAVITR